MSRYKSYSLDHDEISDNRQRSIQFERKCQEAIKSRLYPTGLGKARENLSLLRQKLQMQFVDRDDAIDALLASLISRAGCVMFGPPGTAKSMLVRSIAKECALTTEGMEANYFEYLLTAHTMPEEIFGPTDISQLLDEQPVVKRRTQGRLPYAEIAFLDEIFRGGSHILNTLLTILNERKYHNGQELETVPLIGFIGAANFPPQTEELEALFDRFPIRIWVKSVLDQFGNQLIKNAHGLIQASSSQANSDDPLISTQELRLLHVELKIKLGNVSASNHRLDEFIQAFKDFKDIGGLSDRAFIQLWYFAGALDLVRSQNLNASFGDGGTGHLDCFKFVAPSHSKIEEVDRKVQRLYKRLGVNGL